MFYGIAYMKKQITLLLAGFTALALVSSARAVPNVAVYSDADFFGTQHGGPNGNPQGVHLGVGGLNLVTGTFNLVAPDATSSFTIAAPYAAGVRGTYNSALGFTPGVQHILPGSVTIRFLFRDPSGGAETFSVSVGSNTLFSQGSFNIQLVLTSNGATASIEGILNSTGMVSYTIRRTTGEFWLDAAYLQATALPEGGPDVALLGLGLVALGAVRYKLAR